MGIAARSQSLTHVNSETCRSIVEIPRRSHRINADPKIERLHINNGLPYGTKSARACVHGHAAERAAPGLRCEIQGSSFHANDTRANKHLREGI